MPWFYLILAIFAETVGTTALKASVGFTKLMPSVVVVLAYGVSFYFLALVLKSIPVGIAYAMWSGLGIVFITAIGWVLFQQRLDLPALIGIGLIIAGIVVMQLFSDVTGP
ncbi:MAG: multidrug efflux SMR transporter [Pseudomonadota bacterium]